MDKPILKNEIEAKINGVATVEDNINEVKEYAISLKEYYSKLVFTDDQKTEAESERATINKLVKQVADSRKRIVDEFKKPINLFENTAKETEKILKETSDFIDVQVKNFEEKEKSIRKENARKIYEENIEELQDIISFEKIFNTKWLNKGMWKKDNTSPEIEKEIIEIREKVKNGLKAIEDLNSEFELEVKNTFLQDFSLENAIFKNTQLNNQKELMSKVSEKKEEIREQKVEKMVTEKVVEEPLEKLLTYTLKITGTLSKQKALKEFLDLNEMTYEKVEENV